jgi:hypothetical protein
LKTAVLLLALLLNTGLLVVAAMAASSDSVSVSGRALAAAAALALAGSVVLLSLARARKLPAWGPSVMGFSCLAAPVFWLLGSADAGTISNQELVFLVVVSLVGWGTWRVFKLLYSPA